MYQQCLFGNGGLLGVEDASKKLFLGFSQIIAWISSWFSQVCSRGLKSIARSLFGEEVVTNRRDTVLQKYGGSWLY